MSNEEQPTTPPAGYMSLHDFWREGYLQEINRRFLHPLGLALEMEISEGGAARFSGVRDARHDPDGFLYAPDDMDGDMLRRGQHIERELARRTAEREQRFGFAVQPLPEAKIVT